jgi:hypothetical protein
MAVRIVENAGARYQQIKALGLCRHAPARINNGLFIRDIQRHYGQTPFTVMLAQRLQFSRAVRIAGSCKYMAIGIVKQALDKPQANTARRALD